MGIFDRFGKKISDTGRDAIETGKGYANISKYNGMISENNEKIRHLMQEIGEKYCQLHMEDAEPTLRTLVSAVADMQAQNRELENEILDLRGLKKCPFCGEIISKSIAYCDKCGNRVLSEDVVVCPNPKCRELLPAGTLFCLKCGKRVVSDTPAKTPQLQKCARCGASLVDGARFCSVCSEPVLGQKAEEQPPALPRKCPKCESPVSEGDVFCPVCGTKVIGGESTQVQPLTGAADAGEETAQKQETSSGKQANVPDYAQVNDIVNQIASETVAVCPRCGSKLEPDSAFCSECGLKL
ncbi:MAG: zinc ribbon domain-containing protein [Clostridiales bacterium]|nr:zinc ribbon domain-containing protein [Clostridiales bacterium]